MIPAEPGTAAPHAVPLHYVRVARTAESIALDCSGIAYIMAEQGNSCDHSRRYPNPLELAGKHSRAAPREQPTHSEVRNLNRPEGEEEPAVVERGEEGYAHTAVGQRIQEAVGNGGQEEEKPHPSRRQPRHSLPEAEADDQSGESRREDQGMGESPVAPDGAIPNPERKSRHVDVRQGTAKRAQCPGAGRHLRPTEAGGDPQSSDGM